MNSYFRVLQITKRYVWVFIGAVACLTIGTLLNGFTLVALVPIVDRVLGGGDVILASSVKIPLTGGVKHFIELINNTDRLKLLWYIGAFVVILYFIKGIFFYFKEYLMEKVGQGVVCDVREKIYNHIQDLSLGYVGGKRSGELVSRITNDVRLLRDGISRGLANTISSFFELVLFLTILIVIDWKLSIFCLFVLSFLMIPIIKIGKLLRSLSSKGQSKMADISSVLFETISGIRIVKAFSMEDYEKNKFKMENYRYYRLMIKAVKRKAFLGPLVEFVGAIVAVGILLLFASKLIRGELTLGWFGLYIGSLIAIIKPIKKISQMNPIMQRATAAGERIFHLLDVKPRIREVKKPVDLAPFNRDIRFINVNFGYETDFPLLKDINITIKKGQVVAFVGPSGVGKTTLLNLIPRFYDPLSGRIEIDGQDIKLLSLKSLRRQLGIVTQETVLFNDTVRANIGYGDTGKEINDIINSAKMANAHDFIEQMPEGYNAIIGEKGFKLSGGEKQRISIARAILKNPRILILDEATSALDTESERLVQDALNKLMEHRTVLVVAHRLSTIQKSDCIMVLKEGRIKQKGTHKELMSQDGTYKTLYNMQFYS